MKKLAAIAFLVIGALLAGKSAYKGTAPAESTQLQSSVRQLAQGMSSASKRKSPLPALQAQDMGTLKAWVQDPARSGNERRASLYLLTQAGPSAIPALTEIAQTQVPHFDGAENPHSIGAYQLRFERSLRVTALESLDQASLQNTEIETRLHQIIEKQTDPSIELLAQISRS